MIVCAAIAWLVVGALGGWYAACGDRASVIDTKPDLAPTWVLAVVMCVCGSGMGPFAFAYARWIYGSHCTFVWRKP